ncbi:MAG: DUF6775 family putative metallopeptidase [Candidatus Omnitrophota bacterium]|mgnify:CR=1 FL=1
MNCKKVYLYDDNCSLNLNPVKEFIERTFKIPVIIKRIKAVVVVKGLALDFIATKKSIKEDPDAYAIIITVRLFGTFDNIDRRMHLRSAFFSYPSVISLSGVVEAPAKPREYYLAKESLAGSGFWELEEAQLKQKLKGRFIDYEDKRLIEVVKGLAAQAMFFYLTGEPFCRAKKCRLYNAHWQEELIYSQVKNRKFCARHSKMVGKLLLA